MQDLIEIGSRGRPCLLSRQHVHPGLLQDPVPVAEEVGPNDEAPNCDANSIIRRGNMNTKFKKVTMLRLRGDGDDLKVRAILPLVDKGASHVSLREEEPFVL